MPSPARPGKDRLRFETLEVTLSKPWRALLARPDESVRAYAVSEVEADLGGQCPRRHVVGAAEG